MKLYRYERSHSGEWMGNIFIAKVHLRVFEVIKETPKGNWILDYGRRKWVGIEGKKRFAYPEEQQAWDNFQARTKRAIKIMKSQIRVAEGYLLAERPKTENALNP